MLLIGTLIIIIFIFIFNKNIDKRSKKNRIINKKIKELYTNYIKNPLPLSCINSTHPAQKLLDINNEILPKIKIPRAYLLHPDLHPDKFKKKLIFFPLDSKIRGKFQQLPHSETSYWKTFKLSLVPEQKFNNIVQDIKKKVDHLFQNINLEGHIISKSIIRILRFQDWFQFHYTIDYYPQGNYFAYRLYLESFISGYSNLKHSKISLVGLISEDRFRLKKAYNYEVSKNVKIYSKFPQTPYKADKHYMRDDNYTTSLLKKSTAEKILKKRGLPRIGMRCYDGIGELKKYCESEKNYLGKPTRKGTWDTPCQKNEECPFYQANKNYPNQRGGCVQGKCQMPLNVRRKGARYYDPNHLPYCYNCSLSNPSCCKEQLHKIPNLKSPDYAFENDIIDRVKHRHLLENLDLKLA